jgi:DNA repair exonuclease SbcCD ATPase subunit
MITRVAMSNWRAFDEREFAFSPGLTFLLGPNGSGKTSILEAIVFGLTGEPATVEQRGQLLRDPARSAIVRVSFAVGDQEYLVERSQSARRAEGARLTRAGESRTLATGQARVTAAVEELLGVSADFLGRIVYMAEGDVFRFLREPPGEALDRQVRRVLGLGAIETFVRALDLAAGRVRQQTATLQAALAGADALGVRQEGELDQRLSDLDARRAQRLGDLHALQDQISARRQARQELATLAGLLAQALPVLQTDPDAWASAQREPLAAVYVALERAVAGERAAAQAGELEQARLAGEAGAYERSRKLLAREDPGQGRCPTCGRALAPDERRAALERLDASRERLEAALVAARAKHAAAGGRVAAREASLAAARELHLAFEHRHTPLLNVAVPLTALAGQAAARRAGLDEEVEHLERAAAELQQELGGVGAERERYLAVQRTLRELGFATPGAAVMGLVAIEARALTLRAAGQAADETLMARRNTDLEGLYAQIARVWAHFLGRPEDWRLALDAAGRPVLTGPSGRPLDLGQFSGGEKTALLIVLHTIVARQFARSDFLLVDEPMEHLDPANRRVLLAFLVEACRRQAFAQAIVATFEEPLVRKYLGREGVNVVTI